MLSPSSFSQSVVKPQASIFSLVARSLDAVSVLLGMVFVALWYQGATSLHFWVLALSSACILQLSAEFAEIYRSWRSETLVKEMKQVSACWLATYLATLAIAAVFNLTPDLFVWPQYAQWFLVSLLFLMGWRLTARLILQKMRKDGRNIRRVAIVGSGQLALDVAHRVENCTWAGYEITGFYADKTRRTNETAAVDEIKGNLHQLIALAKTGHIDSVYITMPMREEAKIKALVNQLASSTVSVFIVPDVFMFDLLHARTHNLNGIPAIGLVGEPNRGTQSLLKRLEDMVLASAILLLISPIMLTIAALVKATSPGTVFFRQTRYGLDGKPFKVWKFRSMTVCEDGDSVKQAQKGDARITPLGAFLRKTSLDELPQFINVLQGNMSIVGPRPHAVAHNEMYRDQIDGYMLRHKIKPGITGWAQINGWRGETDTLEKMEKRVEFDLHYIKNWSVFWDVKIVFLTIFKGFVNPNAY